MFCKTLEEIGDSKQTCAYLYYKQGSYLLLWTVVINCAVNCQSFACEFVKIVATRCKHSNIRS